MKCHKCDNEATVMLYPSKMALCDTCEILLEELAEEINNEFKLTIGYDTVELDE